jgi:DNA repair exonuclease SbcCD nuclease subunit
MKKIITLILFSLISINNIHNQSINYDDHKSLKFVSFPDFFNFDVPNPWPPWDAAVNYFLNQVKSEDPDFVLVAGDLVDGHWWDSPKCVQHMGSLYYSDWIQRMQAHDLIFYTAVGDHELGDDPWPAEKRKLVPYFEKVYSENLKMPANGPDTKKGLAYYVRKENFLLITVETFEIVDDSMYTDVIGEQLEWFKNVLNANRDVKFKIVQGHIPIWGDINYRSSSRLMLNNGKQSEFYKTMKQHDIDLYLCGEFHDVTVLESDGIWQIVHGSSWGREIVNTQDYLVGEIQSLSNAEKNLYGC